MKQNRATADHLFPTSVRTLTIMGLLTGMPAVYPMLPVMMCELAVYGGLTGVLYNIRKWRLYPSLIVSMLAGRLVHGSHESGSAIPRKQRQ